MIRWREDYRAQGRVKGRAKDRSKVGGEPWLLNSCNWKNSRHYTFRTSRLATNFGDDSLENPVFKCTSAGVDMAITGLAPGFHRCYLGRPAQPAFSPGVRRLGSRTSNDSRAITSSSNYNLAIVVTHRHAAAFKHDDLHCV